MTYCPIQVCLQDSWLQAESGRLRRHRRLVNAIQLELRARAIDATLLLFNRAHKTGSENMAALLGGQLAAWNGFRHRRALGRGVSTDVKRIGSGERIELARAMHNDSFRPASYDRHLYFFDFEEVGWPNPVWFSLVRDPIRKYESK